MIHIEIISETEVCKTAVVRLAGMTIIRVTKNTSLRNLGTWEPSVINFSTPGDISLQDALLYAEGLKKAAEQAAKWDGFSL